MCRTNHRSPHERNNEVETTAVATPVTASVSGQQHAGCRQSQLPKFIPLMGCYVVCIMDKSTLAADPRLPEVQRVHSVMCNASRPPTVSSCLCRQQHMIT